jgi:Acyclic terpene utilisation family protein AtuA
MVSPPPQRARRRPPMSPLRIGAGAGYSGDRIEPAVELAERGELDYLVFECLAERTIALAQQARRSDPDAGYDPLLADRFNAVLGPCVANKVKIITKGAPPTPPPPRAPSHASPGTWSSGD